MLTILALIGALIVGAIAGLIYRGFVMIGDRRQLDVLSHQLIAEHRMSEATRHAIAQMRSVASEYRPSAGE